MENKLNNLDQIIKDVYELYEAPYDPSHWESIQKELDTMAPSPVKYFSSITTGLVAASLVFMGMLFFVSEATHNLSTAEPIPVTTMEKGSGETEESLNFSERLQVSGKKAENEAIIESQTALIEGSSLDEVSELEAAAEKKNELKKNPVKKTALVKSNDAPVKSTNEHSASVESNERSVRMGCTGLTIDFEASKEYGHDAKYLWNFGDGFFSNEANPSHTFNKPGTFDVSLSVTSYTTGQITSNVVQAMIDVVEAPVANMDVELIGSDKIVLRNKSFRADEVEWSMDRKSLGAGPAVSFNLADNTRYEIQLSALSSGGCTDTLHQEISISNSGASLPREIRFSEKETLTPASFVADAKMIQFNVMDSRGNVIYTAASNQTWKGEDISGKTIESGTYQWAMAVQKNDLIQISKGTFKIF